MFDAIYANIDVQMLKLVTKAVPIYQLKREKCTNHLSCIASFNLKQIYLLVTLGFLFFTCLNWDAITHFVARPVSVLTAEPTGSGLNPSTTSHLGSNGVVWTWEGS